MQVANGCSRTVARVVLVGDVCAWEAQCPEGEDYISEIANEFLLTELGCSVFACM